MGRNLPVIHGRLGRAARPRVVAWQIGTAGSWAVAAFGLGGLAGTISASVLALAVAAAVATPASAFRSDRRRTEPQPSA